MRKTFKKELNSGIQIIPNTTTDVTTTDSVIWQIGLANVTGSAATVTIKDKQGTPRFLTSALSLPANSYTLVVFPHGALMLGGITWEAGSSNAIQADLFCTYK